VRVLGPLFLFSVSQSLAWAGLEWEAMRREVRPEAGEKVVVAAFPFRNSGEAALKIDGIQTSCGCTAAKAEPKEIPAGGSGSIEVRFTAGKRTGVQLAGVIIRTSDGQRHKLVLRVELPER